LKPKSGLKWFQDPSVALFGDLPNLKGKPPKNRRVLEPSEEPQWWFVKTVVPKGFIEFPNWLAIFIEIRLSLFTKIIKMTKHFVVSGI
jgi:hypothetical protein